MKKYLIWSLIFAIAGLLAGVYYREFSKIMGLEGQYTALNGVHVHFLALGVIGMLVFGLVTTRLNATGVLSKLSFLFFVIGTAGTGVMLITRGTMQMTELAGGGFLTSSLNGMVSGIAGVFHVVLAAGIILTIISWIKACNKKEAK